MTFHAKGGIAVIGDHVQMDLGNQLRLHRAGFNAVAAFPQFKQTPIYITEADPDGCAACPASTMPADAYRNSTAYGAYEIAMMKHTLELEAAGRHQAGRPADVGIHVSGHAVFRRVSRPRHERHQPPGPGRVQAAGSPGRDPLAADQQRRAHARTTFLRTACAASRRSTAWPRWTAPPSKSWCGTITMTS